MLKINLEKLKRKIKEKPAIYKFFKKIYNKVRYFFSLIIKAIYFPYIELKKETIEIDRDSKIVDIPILICDSLSADGYPQNAYYGTSNILKSYANIPLQSKLMATIEHGLVLQDTVWEGDLQPNARGIITFSQYRKNIISKYTNKKVFPVGPYIHYAKLIDNKKLRELKEKLGKTLTFFPAHSTHWIEAQFNHSETIQLLTHLSKEFDSILVCFYWKDYKPDIVSLYRNHNFHCTTAGHIFDWNFLNRLKSIIHLSDVTASNTIGTHTGYCIYMQKPHWLFHQEITHNFSQNCSPEEIERYYRFTPTKEYEQLSEALAKNSITVTSEQYRICEFLWGFNEIKTKEDLNVILSELTQS